jgi:hypothetical protein
MKYPLIPLGQQREYYIVDSYEYGGYKIDLELTVMGSIRVKTYRNDVHRMYFEYKTNWCCGKDGLLVFRAISVVMSLIDSGEITSCLQRSEILPIDNDDEFMDWFLSKETTTSMMVWLIFPYIHAFNAMQEDKNARFKTLRFNESGQIEIVLAIPSDGESNKKTEQ